MKIIFVIFCFLFQDDSQIIDGKWECIRSTKNTKGWTLNIDLPWAKWIRPNGNGELAFQVRFDCNNSKIITENGNYNYVFQGTYMIVEYGNNIITLKRK